MTCRHILFAAEDGGFVCSECGEWYEDRWADFSGMAACRVSGQLPRNMKQSRSYIRDRAVDVRARTIERKNDQYAAQRRATLEKESLGEFWARKKRITVQGG